MRHDLSNFFASRMWLLVRGRGAAEALAEWLHADVLLAWRREVLRGPNSRRDLAQVLKNHRAHWQRLLNLLYGCAEDAPRSTRPLRPPPPPRDPPAG
eukprot:3142606-Prymnesium_polylepis.1